MLPEDMKTLKKLLDNFVNNRTIDSFFSKKKKCVFFDNVDILLSSDRHTVGFLMSFVETAMEGKKVSFVMTCSTSEEKRMTELKKKTTNMKLSNPSKQDTLVFVSAVLDSENIPYDGAKLLKLVDTHNNNIRNVINNLHQMSFSDDDLRAESKRKLLYDSNVFDILTKTYSQPLTVNEMRCLSDNSLVPLLMHENLLLELGKNRTKQTRNAYYEALDTVLEYFISSETMEQFMYAHTEWDLYDTVTILKCKSINQVVNRFAKKPGSGYDNFVFTQLLTKAALRCHYNKRLAGLKIATGITETDTLYFLLDCFAEEIRGHPENVKAIKRRLGLSKEDLATVQQYFSLFTDMEKNVLAKFKKTLS